MNFPRKSSELLFAVVVEYCFELKSFENKISLYNFNTKMSAD